MLVVFKALFPTTAKKNSFMTFPVFHTAQECSILSNVTMMHCDNLTGRAEIRDGVLTKMLSKHTVSGVKMGQQWK